MDENIIENYFYLSRGGANIKEKRLPPGETTSFPGCGLSFPGIQISAFALLKSLPATNTTTASLSESLSAGKFDVGTQGNMKLWFQIHESRIFVRERKQRFKYHHDTSFILCDLEYNPSFSFSSWKKVSI